MKPASWKLVRTGLIVQAFALMAYLVTTAVIAYLVIAKRMMFRDFGEEILTTLFAIAVTQLLGSALCLFTVKGNKAKERFVLAFICNVVVLTILSFTLGEEPISLLVSIFCFYLGIWALIEANQRLSEHVESTRSRKVCDYARTALWLAIAVGMLRIWYIVIAPWFAGNFDANVLAEIAKGLTLAVLLAQLLLVVAEIRMLMQVHVVLGRPERSDNPSLINKDT